MINGRSVKPQTSWLWSDCSTSVEVHTCRVWRWACVWGTSLNKLCVCVCYLEEIDFIKDNLESEPRCLSPCLQVLLHVRACLAQRMSFVVKAEVMSHAWTECQKYSDLLHVWIWIGFWSSYVLKPFIAAKFFMTVHSVMWPHMGCVLNSAVTIYAMFAK